MRVLIIGSGMGGVGVAEELLRTAPDTQITLLTQDPAGYYSRPLLSHCFAKPENFSRMMLKSWSALRDAGIQVRLGTATAIDRSEARVLFTDPDGQEGVLPYDALVLATGSEAFVPPPWQSQREHFHVLNSYGDVLALREIRERSTQRGEPASWVLVGGGLIGCELASDLREAGDAVTLLHGADRLMERALTPEVSARLLAHLKERGVQVLLSQNTQSFAAAPRGVVVTTAEGRFCVDGAVVCIGFRPRTSLASACGLVTQMGIQVDENLRTADPRIWVAGDVAEVDGKLHPFVAPVRAMGKHVALSILGQVDHPWQAPSYTPRIKVHGFQM